MFNTLSSKLRLVFIQRNVGNPGTLVRRLILCTLQGPPNYGNQVLMERYKFNSLSAINLTRS